MGLGVKGGRAVAELDIMDAEEYCMNYFSEKKVTWNKSNPEEVEAARIKFDSLLQKGFMAFIVGPKGDEKQIKQFDPDLETIFFAPILQGG